MTSLHERLCTWVQVHHLYKPTRNGILDAYLKHHVANCLHCQQEIDAIESLGASVGALDFDIASGSVEYFTAIASFKYTIFEVEPL